MFSPNKGGLSPSMAQPWLKTRDTLPRDPSWCYNTLVWGGTEQKRHFLALTSWTPHPGCCISAPFHLRVFFGSCHLSVTCSGAKGLPRGEGTTRCWL